MGYKTGGGKLKFYLYKKCVCVWGGGGGNVLAMLKGWGGGGDTTSFEVVLTWELEVFLIMNGVAKGFHLNRGGRGTTSFGSAIFPFCSPPPPPPPILY